MFLWCILPQASCYMFNSGRLSWHVNSALLEAHMAMTVYMGSTLQLKVLPGNVFKRLTPYTGYMTPLGLLMRAPQ